MNTQKGQELIGIAERSIRIISLLLHGKTTGEVVRELADSQPPVKHNLVHYYLKLLTQNENQNEK